MNLELRRTNTDLNRCHCGVSVAWPADPQWVPRHLPAWGSMRIKQSVHHWLRGCLGHQVDLQPGKTQHSMLGPPWLAFVWSSHHRSCLELLHPESQPGADGKGPSHLGCFSDEVFSRLLSLSPPWLGPHPVQQAQHRDACFRVTSAPPYPCRVLVCASAAGCSFPGEPGTTRAWRHEEAEM